MADAAAEIARANLWREGICASTTGGLLNLASPPSFIMPSLGSCGRGVNHPTDFEATVENDVLRRTESHLYCLRAPHGSDQ